MILLFDIGNTHTHVGLGDDRRVRRQTDIPTLTWFGGGAAALVKKFAGKNEITGAVLCSVVPRATPLVRKTVRTVWKCEALELNPKTIRGVGIDYPKPNSIGPDRLANAVTATFVGCQSQKCLTCAANGSSARSKASASAAVSAMRR